MPPNPVWRRHRGHFDIFLFISISLESERELLRAEYLTVFIAYIR